MKDLKRVDRVFPRSLCHGCAGVQYTQNQRGSLFMMCHLTSRRYAPQPVRQCASQRALIRWGVMVTTATKREVQAETRSPDLTHEREIGLWVNEATHLWMTRTEVMDGTQWRCGARSPDTLHFSRESALETQTSHDRGELPPARVAPHLSLSLNSFDRLQLNLTPTRGPILGWLELDSLSAHDLGTFISHEVSLRFQRPHALA